MWAITEKEPIDGLERYSQFFSDALTSGSRYQLSGTNFVESYESLKGPE